MLLNVEAKAFSHTTGQIGVYGQPVQGNMVDAPAKEYERVVVATTNVRDRLYRKERAKHIRVWHKGGDSGHIGVHGHPVQGNAVEVPAKENERVPVATTNVRDWLYRGERATNMRVVILEPIKVETIKVETIKVETIKGARI